MPNVFNMTRRGCHVAIMTTGPLSRLRAVALDVGRLLAECGFCATAIPLANRHIAGGLHSRNFRPIEPIAA